MTDLYLGVAPVATPPTPPTTTTPTPAAASATTTTTAAAAAAAAHMSSESNVAAVPSTQGADPEVDQLLTLDQVSVLLNRRCPVAIACQRRHLTPTMLGSLRYACMISEILLVAGVRASASIKMMDDKGVPITCTPRHAVTEFTVRATQDGISKRTSSYASWRREFVHFDPVSCTRGAPVGDTIFTKTLDLWCSKAQNRCVPCIPKLQVIQFLYDMPTVNDRLLGVPRSTWMPVGGAQNCSPEFKTIGNKRARAQSPVVVTQEAAMSSVATAVQEHTLRARNALSARKCREKKKAMIDHMRSILSASGDAIASGMPMATDNTMLPASMAADVSEAASNAGSPADALAILNRIDTSSGDTTTAAAAAAPVAPLLEDTRAILVCIAAKRLEIASLERQLQIAKIRDSLIASAGVQAELTYNASVGMTLHPL